MLIYLTHASFIAVGKVPIYRDTRRLVYSPKEVLLLVPDCIQIKIAKIIDYVPEDLRIEGLISKMKLSL